MFHFSAKIETTQANLEKGYDRLKELADERHSKLDENLKLYQFNREVLLQFYQSTTHVFSEDINRIGIPCAVCL